MSIYSPNSPVLSSLGEHQHMISVNSQCLKFKYFTTFLICTTSLGLLSASLATHKWIVSRPTRVLRLAGAQANITSLMLTAQRLDEERGPSPGSRSAALMSQELGSDGRPAAARHTPASQFQQSHNSKFQGEIYFGLFNGVKVLNYGFGDRVSQISVLPAKDNSSSQHELVNFKLWLSTLVGVSIGILSALLGSIFAIINFVMTPRGTLTGPVGLVIWNAAACFSCLLAIISWLVEYFVKLQANVLTQEEVANGWTSENRSQFGYSYYFVVLAFILHLVNIFIVSIVQFETWTSGKAAKRQSRSAACEGVIMLY